MGYSLDLDEYTEEALEAELAQRKRDQADGKCDYCHRPHGVVPGCKFPTRHAGPSRYQKVPK